MTAFNTGEAIDIGHRHRHISFGPSRESWPRAWDVALALSGLAHMVLVMMVLSPSRAVPPSLSGEIARDDMVVTLTGLPQKPVQAAPKQAPEPPTPQPAPIHAEPPDSDRRIHFPPPKLPVRQTAKPVAAAAPADPIPATHAEAAVAASPPPSAPVMILHPKFRQPPEPAVYPPRALELSQQGEVLVRARIDCGGNPEVVEVARGSGFPMLDEAALQAVRRWRFVPAQVDGIAVVATVQVPVVFHLQ
jgi:protein TonB